jgi:hypothetical protein
MDMRFSRLAAAGSAGWQARAERFQRRESRDFNHREATEQAGALTLMIPRCHRPRRRTIQ